MLRRTVFGFIVMMFALVQVGHAQGKEGVQKHFSETASKVKATENPELKREILDESFQKMSSVLERVQTSPLISKEDIAGIDRLKATLQEKQDEMAGLNGFERVSDGELDAFATYVVQDMEQAEKTITISLIAALLIVILIVLIA